MIGVRAVLAWTDSEAGHLLVRTVMKAWYGRSQMQNDDSIKAQKKGTQCQFMSSARAICTAVYDMTGPVLSVTVELRIDFIHI